MLACDLSDIKLFCIFCEVTDISAMVSPIGVKFCMMANIIPRQKVSPFGGGTPKDPQNQKFWE